MMPLRVAIWAPKLNDISPEQSATNHRIVEQETIGSISESGNSRDHDWSRVAKGSEALTTPAIPPQQNTLMLRVAKSG